MSAPVMVNGQALPKLKVAHVIELSEAAWRWGRERLNGDTADIKAHDAERGTMRQLGRYASTIEGACAIVEKSLKLAGIAGTIDDLDIDPIQLQETAFVLLGIKLVPIAPDDADPTNPKPRTTG